jgi:hypothetical protein
MFSVMSGKIDTVFFATERILSLLEKEHAVSMEDAVSSLRADIIQVNNRACMNGGPKERLWDGM